MRPEDMNTINTNGRAFNGNKTAVYIAIFFVSMAVFAAITHTVLLIIS